MVTARHAFLQAGHYQPIAERLGELVTALVDDGAVIADAGCGEGYYADKLFQRLADKEMNGCHCVGFDISKWAVQASARRFPATWLVASNRHIPLFDNSVDLLLSLFGFPVYESFRRVLKPGSKLLLVNTGPRHLIELREVIYPRIDVQEPGNSAEMEQAQAAGLSVESSESLAFSTAPLSQHELTQLLTMTPHMFRASREGKAKAALLDGFPVTVDVNFQILGCE